MPPRQRANDIREATPKVYRRRTSFRGVPVEDARGSSDAELAATVPQSAPSKSSVGRGPNGKNKTATSKANGRQVEDGGFVTAIARYSPLRLLSANMADAKDAAEAKDASGPDSESEASTIPERRVVTPGFKVLTARKNSRLQAKKSAARLSADESDSAVDVVLANSSKKQAAGLTTTRRAESSRKRSELNNDVPVSTQRWNRVFLVSWTLFAIYCTLYLRWAPSWAIFYLICGSLLAMSVAAYRLGFASVSQQLVKIDTNRWNVWTPVKPIADALSRPVMRATSTLQMTRLFVLFSACSMLMFGAVFHSTFRVVLFDDYQDVEMTRVGAVDDVSAKIWLRYPSPAAGGKAVLPVRLYFREKGAASSASGSAAPWLDGPSVSINATADWTAVAVLTSLKPSTEYEYTWMSQSGGAVNMLKLSSTGRRGEKLRLKGDAPIYPDDLSRFTFRTAPAAGAPAAFTFAFGSCIKPNVPYGTGVRGFDVYARHRPDFMMFLGDFIYVDFSPRLGSSTAHYNALYRETLGHPESVRFLSSTPSVAIFDDHEILNDWESGTATQPYPAAMVAYRNYLGRANPSVSTDNKTFYYTFKRGDNAFFVLDTRSHRKTTNAAGTSLPYADAARSMLGLAQLQHLLSWLSAMQTQGGAVFKFIITGVPFTYNWRSGDTWYGFQYERQRILDFIHSHGITNVVFLSGDRHQVAVTEFEYKTPLFGATSIRGTPVVEFSVSPINQFGLPFSWHAETENGVPGSLVSFPESEWFRDRKLYYNYQVGHTQVGRIHVDTVTDKQAPRLVFCVFGGGEAEENSANIDCGGAGGTSNGKPLFRYEYQAAPVVTEKGR